MKWIPLCQKNNKEKRKINLKLKKKLKKLKLIYINDGKKDEKREKKE